MIGNRRINVTVKGNMNRIGAVALTGLIASGSIAVAQEIVPVSEDNLVQSFRVLRTQSQLHIRVAGQTFRGSSTQGISADLYWQTVIIDNRKVTRFELIEQYERPNGTYDVLNRLIGDGVTLSRYDALAKEISSRPYGSLNGPQPPRYVDSLLDLVSTTPADTANFAVRLLRDIHSGDDARYSGWLPGNSRLSNEYMLAFTLGVPKTRELQFWFNPVSQELTQIRYEEIRNLGNVYRGTNWTMTVDNDFTTYVPFQPWKAAATAGWKTVPWNNAQVERG
jgi:hypothetical protein